MGMDADDSGKTVTQTDASLEMLKKIMDDAMEKLRFLLDTRGIHLDVLGEAMALFVRSLVDLPDQAACKKGCAYCCHLRVGVSIPEVVVIFNGLQSLATPEGLAFLERNVIQVAQKGNALDDNWWRTSRTACPFLDINGQNHCLIYELRPFSCRAYHSTDMNDCRIGFEQKIKTQIPCFPLYRAVTDMYSTIFIQGLAQKGLFSYQVGFVKALQILFENDRAVEQWLSGDDVFEAARLR